MSQHYNFHRRRSGLRSTLQGESEATGEAMSLKLKLLPVGEEHSTNLAGRRGRVFADDDESDANSDDAYEEEDGEEDRGHRSEDSQNGNFEGDGSDLDPHELLDEPKSSPSNDQKPSPHPLSAKYPPLSFAGAFVNVPITGQPPLRDVQDSRTIRGKVSITPDGHVHWTYVIRYSGIDQWLMNGVSIGGIGSRYGVVGCWSTVDHDRAGPNGEFIFPRRACRSVGAAGESRRLLVLGLLDMDSLTTGSFLCVTGPFW